MTNLEDLRIEHVCFENDWYVEKEKAAKDWMKMIVLDSRKREKKWIREKHKQKQDKVVIFESFLFLLESDRDTRHVL